MAPHLIRQYRFWEPFFGESGHHSLCANGACPVASIATAFVGGREQLPTNNDNVTACILKFGDEECPHGCWTRRIGTSFAATLNLIGESGDRKHPVETPLRRRYSRPR